MQTLFTDTLFSINRWLTSIRMLFFLEVDLIPVGPAFWSIHITELGRQTVPDVYRQVGVIPVVTAAKVIVSHTISKPSITGDHT